ncbi:unnamed protein product [Amoebophrya sp. A120]|nr:unnamed protein product [Amoebophrya sp. A120]|eukprot:GSA120T00002243001.1
MLPVDPLRGSALRGNPGGFREPSANVTGYAAIVGYVFALLSFLGLILWLVLVWISWGNKSATKTTLFSIPLLQNIVACCRCRSLFSRVLGEEEEGQSSSDPDDSDESCPESANEEESRAMNGANSRLDKSGGALSSTVTTLVADGTTSMAQESSGKPLQLPMISSKTSSKNKKKTSRWTRVTELHQAREKNFAAEESVGVAVRKPKRSSKQATGGVEQDGSGRADGDHELHDPSTARKGSKNTGASSKYKPFKLRSYMEASPFGP